MRSHLGSFAWLFLIFCLAATTSAQQDASTIATVVPTLVSFSGTVRDINGKPLTEIVGVTFSLYKDFEGGAPIWMETQNVQPDKTGHYSVMLGSTSSHGMPAELFASGEARWLGVRVQGGEELPRVLLLSVPYAMKAADAQTLGGLPASAFMLAAPSTIATDPASTAANSTGASVPPSAVNVTTSGAAGNIGTVALFSTATDIEKSIVTQTGTTAVNVGGNLNVNGTFKMPALGASTALKGFNSRPEQFVASSFNSTSSVPVAQTFVWQAEAAGNNTASPSATFNLLFGSGVAVPAETGLNVNSKGIFHFAPGQTFPGTGPGTVKSVGLAAPATDFKVTGSPVTGTGTLNIAWTVAPTAVSTANAIVKRDSGGSFSANDITVVGVFANSVSSSAVTGNEARFTTANSANTSGTFANTAGGPILSALTTGSGQLAGISGAGVSGAAMLVSAPAAPVQLEGMLVFGGNSSSGNASVGIDVGGGNAEGTGNAGAGISGVGGTAANGNGGAGGTFTGWFGGGPDGDGVDATNFDGGTLALSGAYAGNFTGDLNVSGAITAGTKDFKIDHPLDPANKYLFHASVESSEMKNIYDGLVALDGSGTAIVNLPSWFETVNGDFRYQLTAVGKPSPGLYIAEKISGNHFTIAGGSPGAEVSWQVTGIRQDPYAKANPLVVEQLKSARERGYYIHPELYGAPHERQIEWARNPAWMRKIKDLKAKRSHAKLAQPLANPARASLNPVTNAK